MVWALAGGCGDVLPPVAPSDGATPSDGVAPDDENARADAPESEASATDVSRDGTSSRDVSIDPSFDATIGDGSLCGAPVDCALAACDGLSCGANGRVCRSSACTCPGGQMKETTCNDGADNDCDGLKDCADPDCLRAQCGGSTNQRCCGTTCVDTETDPSNCQGCGTVCAAGHLCKRFSDSYGVRGMCTCSNGDNMFCVRNPAAVCRSGNPDGVNNVCACWGEKYGAAGCAEGQICVEVQAGPNFCRY
jgi:hypothetical protein